MTEKDLKKENKATDKENEKQPLSEESMDKVTGGKGKVIYHDRERFEERK